MEYVIGYYGGLALRETGPIWDCFDSDYSWYAVVDDYGNLVPVSSFKNIRGY